MAVWLKLASFKKEGKMHKLALSLCVAVLLSAGSASAKPQSAATYRDCLSTKGHVYEACYAYVVNDSILALAKYYKYVHSDDAKRAADAREDFLYRYHGAARQLIEQRVAKWPKGDNRVQLPVIQIVSARSSLATNTASLVTRETWRISTTDGLVLYSETGKLRHVSMARIRGKLLHIWVVTSIS